MIHIIGKGDGDVVVIDDEHDHGPCDHNFGDSNVCLKCGAVFGGAADPRISRRAAPTTQALAEADFWDAAVGEDDLRPAHSNAAPPLG